MHLRLNVHFGPGCFSKTIHRIVFKIYISILQILKMCNAVVLIEKMENCQSYRIKKHVTALFFNQCTKTFSNSIYSDSTDIDHVQRRNFDSDKEWKLYNLLNFENWLGLCAFSNQYIFFPGGFSKTIHRVIFKSYIVILQILKKCNVVDLIEKSQNYRFLKIIHLIKINLYDYN